MWSVNLEAVVTDSLGDLVTVSLDLIMEALSLRLIRAQEGGDNPWMFF
jgi:hypothetical protein